MSNLRPNLYHTLTSPELMGFRQFELDLALETGVQCFSPVPEIEKKDNKELLDALAERLNEEYRDITFPIQLQPNPKYAPRVSFDTIDICYAEEPVDDDLLYTRLLEGTDRGRGRDREFVVRSPSSSPNRLLSPIGNPGVSIFRNHIAYPTTPIITRRGCTFLRTHKDFEDLYLGKLASKNLRPVLPRRVILVYISGRKHTWVALDWILRSFIENGDTVIVAAAMNHSLGRKQTRNSNYPSPLNFQAKTARVRFRQRTRPEFIKSITSNVMNYCLKVVNPDVISRITVEILEGKTKDVLRDMYRLYEPNIVSTASKVNSRNSAPLKSWNSSRLSDRLVKNFPLPVLVVPALNMARFERSLRRHIMKENGYPMSALASSVTEMSADTSKVSTSIVSGESDAAQVPPSEQTSTSKNEDILSLSDSLHSSDTGSMSSSDSYNSYEEIAELYEDYKNNIHNKLDELSTAEVNEHYFSNFARAISDKSLLFCEELSSVNPDFKGQGALLARAITGSNSFGAVPYKTKSLLAPLEDKKSGLSYEELKRNLMMNAARKQSIGMAPSISVLLPTSSSTSGHTTPKHTSLKFAVDAEAPTQKRAGSKLKKYLSHDESSSGKVDLKVSKSHPDIRGIETPAPDSEKKKKKKKKKFWKLF